MKTRLLIVANGPGLKDRVAQAFHQADFELLHPGVQDSLDTAVTELGPHLVIIEHSPPAVDGYGLCSLVRGISKAPIVMLGDSHDAQEHVNALAAGADIYLARPYTPSQLVARSRALLRRAGQRKVTR